MYIHILQHMKVYISVNKQTWIGQVSTSGRDALTESRQSQFRYISSAVFFKNSVKQQLSASIFLEF